MIHTAASVSDKVLVILGVNFEAIEATLQNTGAGILYNEDWEQGMSSSIKLAVSHIRQEYANADAVIFTVCDQPFVNVALLQKMIDTSGETGTGIIACGYNDTVGVPALFKKAYFAKLLTLSGKEGAKKIIGQYLQDVYTIPFPLGSIDIDTEKDFNGLLKNRGQ